MYNYYIQKKQEQEVEKRNKQIEQLKKSNEKRKSNLKF
jgi:hypothetical protein